VSQAGALEKMKLELKKAGHDVAFVVVNKADAAETKGLMTAQVSFPVLQDLETVLAWDYAFGGQKDDFYIYGKDGKLFDYLPFSGERDTNLQMSAGYHQFRNLVLQALAAGNP
jgi:hypothetical protein